MLETWSVGVSDAGPWSLVVLSSLSRNYPDRIQIWNLGWALLLADLNSSGGKRDSYHIAFGSKVSGTGQVRKAPSREVRSAASEHFSESLNCSMCESLSASLIFYVVYCLRPEKEFCLTLQGSASGTGRSLPNAKGHVRSKSDATGSQLLRFQLIWRGSSYMCMFATLWAPPVTCRWPHPQQLQCPA